jgi:hypothetical protein
MPRLSTGLQLLGRVETVKCILDPRDRNQLAGGRAAGGDNHIVVAKLEDFIRRTTDRLNRLADQAR